MADPASLSTFFASLFAASQGAAAAAAPTIGASAGAGAIGSAAAVGSTAVTAGAAAAVPIATAGLSTLQMIQLGIGAAGVASSADALLADKPTAPATPQMPSRDTAQLEADLQSELYKKRGRAAALLTAGKAQGDRSTPNLGSAALLGA